MNTDKAKELLKQWGNPLLQVVVEYMVNKKYLGEVGEDFLVSSVEDVDPDGDYPFIDVFCHRIVCDGLAFLTFYNKEDAIDFQASVFDAKSMEKVKRETQFPGTWMSLIKIEKHRDLISPLDLLKILDTFENLEDAVEKMMPTLKAKKLGLI